MSATEARYYLQQTKRKYFRLRIVETFLAATSIGVFFYCVCALLSVQTSIAIAASFGVSVAYFIFRSLQLNIFHVRDKGVVHYINQHYPQMEESADLLLKEDDELTSLQQLQKLRSIHHFESLYPSIKFPHNLSKVIGILVVSLMVYAGLAAFLPDSKNDSVKTSGSSTSQNVNPLNLPASIEKAIISITPPAYTGIQKQNVSNFNIRLPQSSTVQWTISFTENVTAPQLIFSGKDSVSLSPVHDNQYQTQRTFNSTGFYQVAWRNSDGSKKYSDYFQVEVINDQPPNIAVENLNQFIELDFDDNLKIDLKSTLTDDYGLSDAYIIATVSKGSGESVKFREEKLRFHAPGKITGKSVKANLLIDILRLGLEPGDELYFYVEAYDNKVPVSNRNRTETFFISLLDTASITTSVDPGLGVDLMPEYFRSQRQIIIDSEKLLKEKKKITKEAFNSRSNELGYDQKVLRLRYGEFLGEEFESGIGPQAEIPGQEDHGDEEEDVTKKYGHVHDKENEHNHVEEKKSATPDTHGHDHEQNSGDKEDPSKAYMHMHDSEEEATFFTQSIRSKLKAAITIMWDAELYLRLYEPEKSLPFQYRALKLLKEISQDSRIYVHRTGFDPPPLKEEKRLSGDLTEIKSSTALHEELKGENYPSIRKAIQYIEQLLSKDEFSLTSESRIALVNAGQELAVVAIAQPGRYLKSLSLLKALTENEVNPAEKRNALLEIRSAFWNVLPKEVSSPQAGSQTPHALDQRFLDNLKALKQK